MKRFGLAGLMACAALACASIPGPAAAQQSVEDFYKGKTVMMMIGYGAGGTDDAWARLLAKHMGQFIPGHPTVVPSNVPGAGSLLLANQVYNTQPKDGTVIGLINRGVPFEPLFGGNGTRFDPQKFNYIGSPDRDTLVCVARNDAPVKKMDDLLTTQFIVGSTGSGADSQTYPEFLSNLLGVKMKLVQGYPGSRDILLATERGEVQGGCVSYDTIARDAMYREKKSFILFQTALQPDDRIPEVPSITSLAKSADDQAVLRLFLQRTLVGRPFVMAPGVPPERVEAIRTAFKAALDDPAFKADAETAGVHIHYVAPDELQHILTESYAAPAPVVERAKKAFGR
jgi:tripartite-type tricarboxylate transporter receptor subunit TctC